MNQKTKDLLEAITSYKHAKREDNPNEDKLNDILNNVQKLIDEGADINNQDLTSPYTDDHNTPLYQVIEDNQLTIFKLLLENNAKIETVNSYKTKPLYRAVALKRYEMVKLLIEKGADTSIVDNHDQTLLDMAKRNYENFQNDVCKKIVELIESKK